MCSSDLEVLKPGEKGELVFTVNVGHSTGVIQKGITVPSNDPATPSVALTIRADISQIYSVNPQTIVVGDITQGVITNFTVQIKRTDGQSLGLDHVVSTSPQVRANIEAGASPQEANIKVAVEGEGAPRRINERIQLFAAGAGTPFHEVIVVGRLVGDVSVVPERLVWGVGNYERMPASRLEAMLTRTVRISATKPDMPVEITNPETTLADMKLELSVVESGRVYMVVAKLPEAPKQSTQGTIKLHTNLPSQPVVEVPFNINVFKN